MKVLITGASGFLGSHLVDRILARGESVRVVLRNGSDFSYLDRYRSQLEIVNGDLANEATAKAATRDINIVYHAAGRVKEEGSYAAFYAENYMATKYLVDSSKYNRVQKFIFISSPSIFTDDRDHLGMDESCPYPSKYANYYAESKALAEQYVLAATGAQMLTCSLRPRGIWGPRDYSGFMPKLTAALALGKLKHLSPHKQVLGSICHVQNAVDACLAAAESNCVQGQAYFITDKDPILVWDLIDRIARLFSLPPVSKQVNPHVLRAAIGMTETIWKFPYLKNNYPPPISRYGIGMLTLHSTYSILKAQRDFQYAPSMDLDNGLVQLRQWIDQSGGLKMFCRNQRI